MEKIGSRVGAILGAENDAVEFLGYGNYRSMKLDMSGS